MDPLSQVFSLLHIRTARCTRFEAGGKWAYHFPAKPALKFAAVLRGECWIDFADGARHRLAAGDTFLLANAPGYVLANDDSVSPEDGIALFDWDHSDVASHNGADTAILAGSFAFDMSDARLLLDSLPMFVLIPASSSSSTVLRETLEILDAEIRSTRIGASLVTSRLADILLVQALRSYLDDNGSDSIGWLGALTDPGIGKAINLMHEDVAHPWTVDELAQAVAISRSGFSRRFKSLVGLAPIDYLLHWRMRLARNYLRRDETVASIAARLGYASESAFGNAFKRIYGRAPRRYWNEQKDE
ncbi:AraC family transcriptional regulator [Allopusillimonas ginsengisoli]|uniref:AraC family transcriptional regulator n=1 Tax=Allopusillimonas ginsengisoli TaxID=453575 RepID=UPI0039C406A0